MALGCSSCSATRSLSQWDRIVQRRAGIGIGALLGRRRPEFDVLRTYQDRCLGRPPLGGQWTYKGLGAKAHYRPDTCHPESPVNGKGPPEAGVPIQRRSTALDARR